MSVLKKLMEARIKLQSTKIEKTGNNKFAGYKYMQLDDFLPATQEIFNNLGLCGVVSFGIDVATLTITDTDSGESVVVSSPMSSAALKGAHEIQNLGAVQTYLRRYLWVTAMEIVEHDALDSSEPLKPEVKKETKPFVKPAPKATFKPDNPMDSTAWKITLKDHEADGWDSAVVDGANMALELATKPDDVVQIFKVNRDLLDRLSAEAPQKHAELVAKFGETKTKLQGEVNV